MICCAGVCVCVSKDVWVCVEVRECRVCFLVYSMSLLDLQWTHWTFWGNARLVWPCSFCCLCTSVRRVCMLFNFISVAMYVSVSLNEALVTPIWLNKSWASIFGLKAKCSKSRQYKSCYATEGSAGVKYKSSKFVLNIKTRSIVHPAHVPIAHPEHVPLSTPEHVSLFPQKRHHCHRKRTLSKSSLIASCWP